MSYLKKKKRVYAKLKSERLLWGNRRRFVFCVERELRNSCVTEWDEVIYMNKWDGKCVPRRRQPLSAPTLFVSRVACLHVDSLFTRFVRPSHPPTSPHFSHSHFVYFSVSLTLKKLFLFFLSLVGVSQFNTNNPPVVCILLQL